MDSNLKAIQLLAHFGKPLNITVHPDPGNPGMYIIERDGTSVSTRNKEKEIRNSLVHYPSPVTINGTPVKTTPFPDLAHLTITRFHPPYHDPEEVLFEFDSYQNTDASYNAYAGGVLCYVYSPKSNPRTYYSPSGQGAQESWQRAIKVNVHPIHRIETEELGYLYENDQYIARISQESPLHQIVTHRDEEQIERSIIEPDAPPKHDGEVYKYFFTDMNPMPFNNEVPIIIHGTPVAIDLQDDANPARPTSLALALYQTGGDLVPVAQYLSERQTNKLPTITGCEVLVQKEDTPQDNQWCFEPVKDIILQLEIDQLGNRSVHADFDLGEAGFREMHVRYTARTDTGILGNAIVMAYWNDEHFPDWDCMQHALDQREEQVNNMILAAFQDPLQAFRNDLQNLANSFEPNLPSPTQVLSERSKDGRVVVIYLPDLEGAN